MKRNLVRSAFWSVTLNLRYYIHKRGSYTHEIVLSCSVQLKKRREKIKIVTYVKKNENFHNNKNYLSS